MRYIKFCAETHYCGTYVADYVEYEDIVSDEVIECDAAQFGEDLADSYEYLAEQDVDREDYATDDDYETALQEAIEDYRANCYYSWKEITKEEYEEMNY
jgi:hypothetical protein